MSPLLWNITAYEILEIINSIKLPGILLIAFADDLMLYISGKTIKEIETKHVETIKKIEEWLDSNNLKISKDKTKALLIGRIKENNKDKRFFYKPVKPPRIKIKERNIPFKKNPKYLGVIIDEKLKFVELIASIKKKTLIIYNELKRFTARNLGAKPKHSKNIIQNNN